MTMDILTVKNDMKAPKWATKAAIDENNKIWIPINWAGNRDSVFMCACFDGEPTYKEDGITFARIEWMRQEFPICREACDKIEASVKNFLEINQQQ